MLTVGMGSPLEPGTYYVGVKNYYSGSGGDMSYTLVSRGIGEGLDGGGQPWAIEVQPLAFAGGVANGTGLAPRDIAVYRVDVPAGSRSWSLRLDPAAGHEALVAVRHGKVPNITAWHERDTPSGHAVSTA